MAEETRQTTTRLGAKAREGACRTIEETEIVHLSVDGQKQIAEASFDAPEPTAALKKAFQRRRELFGVQ